VKHAQQKHIYDALTAGDMIAHMRSSTRRFDLVIAADVLDQRAGGEIVNDIAIRRVEAEFRAWEPRLAPGALVALHDYGNPAYPGVAEAVDELGLSGREHAGLWLWEAPA